MGRGSVFPPEDFGMDEGSACLFGRGEADGLALFGCCGCRGRGGLRRRACGVRLGPGGHGFRPGRGCRAFLEKRCRFFGKVAGLFAGSRRAFSRRGCIRLWPLRGGCRGDGALRLFPAHGDRREVGHGRDFAFLLFLDPLAQADQKDGDDDEYGQELFHTGAGFFGERRSTSGFKGREFRKTDKVDARFFVSLCPLGGKAYCLLPPHPRK